MKINKILCVTAITLMPISAFASDWGCQVILCLANPQGPTAVSECVPPIEKLWDELSKGHGFPSCDMGSSSANISNKAEHQWASGYNCPPQYVYYGGRDGDERMCSYSGVVNVTVSGKPYTSVWWNRSNSVTQLFGEAKQVNGATTKFETDYNAWKARQEAIARENARNNGR